MYAVQGGLISILYENTPRRSVGFSVTSPTANLAALQFGSNELPGPVTDYRRRATTEGYPVQGKFISLAEIMVPPLRL